MLQGQINVRDCLLGIFFDVKQQNKIINDKS